MEDHGPHPVSATDTRGSQIADWVRADVDRAVAITVLTVLGSVTFAGSAAHILTLGARPDVHVHGWKVWTVAGSLEALAAYSAWEVRRRTGWTRIIPGLVLIMSGAFVILANLAAARTDSWSGRLPWDQAFAVAPPVSFMSVFAIAETRQWTNPSRARRKTPKPTAPTWQKETADDTKPKPEPEIEPKRDAADPVPSARLVATAPKRGESATEKRLRLAAAHDACVDEVRAVLKTGGKAGQVEIAAAYGTGQTWAKGVRAEAAREPGRPR